MRIHGIISAYLGDGDFDIGTVSPWLNNFVETLFFYDGGATETNRFYQVDYAKTFPTAKFAYHSTSRPSFFEDSASFRQASFEAADAAWHYADEDWVIFLDATEALGTSLLATDMPLSPDGDFLMLRSVAATAVGQDIEVVNLPFYVFLNQGTVVEETYVIDPDLEPLPPAEQALNRAIYWSCTPHYLSAGESLARFFQVSHIRGTPDWSDLDVLGSIPDDNSIAVVSYAYARWQQQDYHDPSLWTEATDLGFANRVLMEAVRPVGLPVDYDTPDPAGTVPTFPGTEPMLSVPYCYYQDELAGDAIDKFVALFRRNPRDGVWYRNRDIGAAPTDPLTGDVNILTPYGVPTGQQAWDNQVPSGTGTSL